MKCHSIIKMSELLGRRIEFDTTRALGEEEKENLDLELFYQEAKFCTSINKSIKLFYLAIWGNLSIFFEMASVPAA